jgi:hypothetical protein
VHGHTLPKYLPIFRAAPALLQDFVSEQPQELVPVDVFMKNALLLVAARDEVIKGAKLVVLNTEVGGTRCKVKQ